MDFNTISLLIFGLTILIIGGNLLLKAAVSISMKFGIPKLLIGMTVVSLATSAPELIVSIKSAIKGSDGFMEYPFNETSKDDWQKDPSIRNAFQTLVPLAANSAWSPAGDHAELAASGTNVWNAFLILGSFCQSSLLVSLNGYSIKPSEPLIADFILTISSGADVAKETTVIPIKSLGIPNFIEIDTAALSKRLPPIIKMVKPNINKLIVLKSIYLIL